MLDATNSATLTQPLTPVTIAIASAAGSGLFTLVYKIIEKLLDSHFAHGKLIAMDKRQLADELIKICAEGDRKKFQKNAKDGQNILYIANQIGVFDEIARNDLQEYQTFWELAVTFIQRKAPGDVEIYRELEAKARVKSDSLLKLARKWKK